MKKNILCATFAASQLMLIGCYQKHLVLQAEVVSMTQSEAGSTKSLKIGQEVNETWCVDDELAFKQGEDNHIGLADQVIYKAQDGGKKADFITNVRIFRDSNGCALLTGKVAKL